MRALTRILLFMALGLSACGPEVDRIKDPVAKAAYNCRYVLEREIATPDELSPDGVLRRKVADFAEPLTERSGDRVTFTWAPGAITRRDGASAHGGDCAMDISDGGQLVESATLDGTPLHAGFRF